MLFKKVTKLILSAKGCLGYELQRCIEQENKYLVLIKWKTVEDHLQDFKKSPGFEEMKALIGPFYLHVPQVEHYRMIDFN
jgi:heme-degrading monooxygenase HmoA